MNTVLFSRLAELASDRAWALQHPVISGRTYCLPANRADANRAARELETAAILWGSVCHRSYDECLEEARALRTGPVVADFLMG